MKKKILGNAVMMALVMGLVLTSSALAAPLAVSHPPTFSVANMVLLLIDFGLGAVIVFGATLYFVGRAYKKFRG